MVRTRASSPIKTLKKKSGCGCGPFGIILGIVIFLMFGRYLSFWGFEYLDILHYLRPKMTFEETMKLINPLPAKGYTYPSPSEIARSRTIDCSLVYSFEGLGRENPLCLNMFKTDSADIAQALSNGSHDRIVLYGERSVFDGPTSSQGDKNFINNLYNTVKFMDLIAIPKFLDAYGLKDVSYVKTSKPYPYLYFRISNADEADQICHYGSTEEKVQGCARGYSVAIIPIAAVGPQMSNARPILRKYDDKRFSYLTHYPADCYTNETFAHETSHLLNAAGESELGERTIPKWFNEQIAGFFGIYGAELACGKGTVVMQKNPKETDVPKALAVFNADFAPADLSHEYPSDNTCRQAMLTAWYAYISSGDLKERFTNFFRKQRATTPLITDDTVFAKFLMNIDPSSGQLLISKGCSL